MQEYIEGRTLYEEYLMEGGFTEMQISVYVKQLIQYLSILHNNGIYHSDIKPSNIMITKPPPVASQSIINSGYLNQQNVPSMIGFNKSGMMAIGAGGMAPPGTMSAMGMVPQKNTKVIKALNFAHLMNQQQEKYHKKQYNHAEYFSPEQIEKSEDAMIMQSGELWNVGVITYALYQGHFPIYGESDEKII